MGKEVSEAINAVESKSKEWRGTYESLKKERDVLQRRKDSIKFHLEELRDDKPTSKKR